MEKSNEMKTLSEYLAIYQNTAIENDAAYDYFMRQTDNFPFLKEHRDYIELYKLGFGERAFHSMWKMLLEHLTDQFTNPKVLEIGVYKGQIISLWALIAKEYNFPIEITAITPLEGNSKPKNRFITSILSKISKKFRDDLNSGNFYEQEDYLRIIKSVFEKFNLDVEKIKFIKGYSSSPDVLEGIKNDKFHAIYVDGDHTFDGVTKDINNYSPLLCKNGLLIMDDSACNIPSTKYWKGHKSVSDACEIIEDLGFENILNVGHNRIFRKL